MGGEYDVLFLETPAPTLSFIYQSLGCFHTLQPQKDPYSPPAIPALTPQGFVRWQTVQLLLEPEEHVPIIQSAVKRFDIVNPADGLSFPDYLPADSLPSMPDPEMLDWHEGVSQRLMLEAQGYRTRGRLGPGAEQNHRKQLSDGHSDTTAPTEASTVSSSFDGLSITDGRSPAVEPAQPARAKFQIPGHINVLTNGASTLPHQHQPQSRPHDSPPWSPERIRAASMPQRIPEPPNYNGSDLSQSTITQNAPRPSMPPSGQRHDPYHPRHHQQQIHHSHHRRGRSRSPSTLSTTSTDSTLSTLTSSSGDSSRDHSPRRRHHFHQYGPQPPPNAVMPLARPAPPRRHSSHQLDRELIPNANNQLATRTGADGLSNANARGLNVRWGEDQVFDLPPTKKPGLEDIVGVGEGRRRNSGGKERDDGKDRRDRHRDRDRDSDRDSDHRDRREHRRQRRHSSSTGGSDTSGSEGLGDRYRSHRSGDRQRRRRRSDADRGGHDDERRRSWEAGRYEDRRRGGGGGGGGGVGVGRETGVYDRDYDVPPMERRRRHDDHEERYDSDRRRKERGMGYDDGYDGGKDRDLRKRGDARLRRDHFR